MAGIAGVGFTLALGEHGYVYSWLREWVPQLGYVRFPVKFVVVTVFAMPLLVAFAVHHFSELLPEKSNGIRRLIIGISLGVLAVVAIIVAFSFFDPMDGEQWKTTVLSGLTRGMFLVMIVGALISLNAGRTVGKLTLTRLALLALIGADLLTHTPSQNPTILPGAYAPGIVAFSPKPVYPRSRALLTLDAENALRRGTTEDPRRDFLLYRNGLFDNVNLLEDVAQVHGFYSLYLREAERIRLSFVSADQPASSRLADFLGASQISVMSRFIDWQSRLTWFPLLTAGQAPVFSDAETTLRHMIEPTFDCERVVYLPTAARNFVSATNTSHPKIESARFATDRIQLEIQTDSPSMIVFAQAHYHPWHAYVNDRSVLLWRANYAFQALEVPAGRHNVELVYKDRKFQLGALISWLTEFGCVAAWCRWRRTKHPARFEITSVG